VSEILGARYNELDMIHELLVVWRDFPVGENIWESYTIMAVDVLEMVTKITESHHNPDMVSKIRSL
jgi:hypothetical protein